MVKGSGEPGMGDSLCTVAQDLCKVVEVTGKEAFGEGGKEGSRM